jgi:hypothetical protein
VEVTKELMTMSESPVRDTRTTASTSPRNSHTNQPSESLVTLKDTPATSATFFIRCLTGGLAREKTFASFFWWRLLSLCAIAAARNSSSQLFLREEAQDRSCSKMDSVDMLRCFCEIQSLREVSAASVTRRTMYQSSGLPTYYHRPFGSATYENHRVSQCDSNP